MVMMVFSLVLFGCIRRDSGGQGAASTPRLVENARSAITASRALYSVEKPLNFTKLQELSCCASFWVDDDGHKTRSRVHTRCWGMEGNGDLQKRRQS